MKKLLCTLLLAFVCTGSMFAQKGMNGVGLNVPVGVYAFSRIYSRMFEKDS